MTALASGANAAELRVGAGFAFGSLESRSAGVTTDYDVDAEMVGGELYWGESGPFITAQFQQQALTDPASNNREADVNLYGLGWRTGAYGEAQFVVKGGLQNASSDVQGNVDGKFLYTGIEGSGEFGRLSGGLVYSRGEEIENRALGVQLEGIFYPTNYAGIGAFAEYNSYVRSSASAWSAGLKVEFRGYFFESY